MMVGTPPETPSTGRSSWTSGTVERRETCMNKGIEAMVVASPARPLSGPSLSSNGAGRDTPHGDPEPTPSEREPTS
jgi:hypothetical protein